jgi:hypothetical protein
MASPTVCLLVREVGGFWALCGEGRRHRVTAHRLVKRSPCGRSFRAYTRLSLPGGGGEVRWAGGLMYQTCRLGTLVRVGWPHPMACPEEPARGDSGEPGG